MSDGDRHRLFVIRHGATEWSRTGQHTGHTDIALLPEGEAQARATGALLAGHEFALVLTSPLQRARHTCELVGLGAQAQVEPNLIEWDYGEYEGITSAQIHQTAPGWTVWTGAIPGGETIEQVAARADAVIERVLGADGDCIVFAHGHILRTLTARWCELDPREGRRFVLDPATLCVLGWEHDSRAILQWNSR
ncbi:MAG: histidine phosphatase family protein [Actinobacteria bacterium]|nr:histidine phosphatase family protein [Actinomycetota bacterium]